MTLTPDSLSVPENHVLSICVVLSSDGELETDLLVTLRTIDGSAGEVP